MRLLVLRASDDAERTRATLEALDHEVLVSPVLEMAAVPFAWPQGVIDAVAATSGHAFAAVDPPLSPSPEARRLMPLLLVGRRTLDQARENGFLGSALIADNAAELAERTTSMQQPPRRIAYLAGRYRKPDFEKKLEVHGCHVHVLVSYEARAVEDLNPAALAALRGPEAGRNLGVLHYSRRSAALFVRVAEKANLRGGMARHLCLSEDVAEPLKDAGFVVQVAAEANEPSLLALLDPPPLPSDP